MTEVHLVCAGHAVPVREVRVNCVPCHHGTARPQVAGGGDGLQIWRLAANMLNKKSRMANTGWSSSLWDGWGDNNLPL
jgi:hypothetical protein